MAELKDKIQNALDEGRILVLGTQVLIGFHGRLVFEPRFKHLASAAQFLSMGAHALLIVGFALLIVPGAFHHIVEGGEDTPRLHEVTLQMNGYALAPLALGLGVDVGLAAYQVFQRTAAGIAAGVVTAMAATGMWYAYESLVRGRVQARKDKLMADEKSEPSELSTRIKQVLTEARMVLPGAQALLGFQLVTVFMEAFEDLPAVAQWVHFGGLGLTAIATILLMTPAAYHRLVERGEETERFLAVASRLVIAAMIPLGLGIAADFYVVVRKVSGSDAAGIVAGVLACALFGGLWFGWTEWVRKRRTGGRWMRAEQT